VRQPTRIRGTVSVSVVKVGATHLRQPSAAQVARSTVSERNSPPPVLPKAGLPDGARFVRPLPRHRVCCVSGTLGHDALYRNVSDALFKGGHGLTPREAQVCASITLGGNSRNIGRTLGISAHTVATHRKRAYSKLGIRSQNQLFALYYEAIGLLPRRVRRSITSFSASAGRREI
jgi:DNA-binding CsgD family transcriptional regulator